MTLEPFILITTFTNQYVQAKNYLFPINFYI